MLSNHLEKLNLSVLVWTVNEALNAYEQSKHNTEAMDTAESEMALLQK